MPAERYLSVPKRAPLNLAGGVSQYAGSVRHDGRAVGKAKGCHSMRSDGGSE